MGSNLAINRVCKIVLKCGQLLAQLFELLLEVY